MRPDALERYLQALRRELRGLPIEEVHEIERELRSHVLDRTDGDQSEMKLLAALDSIGDPREIARINLQLRGAADISNAGIVETAPNPRHALTDIGRALLALMLSVIGYGFAGCWLVVALTKPLAHGSRRLVAAARPQWRYIPFAGPPSRRCGGAGTARLVDRADRSADRYGICRYHLPL